MKSKKKKVKKIKEKHLDDAFSKYIRRNGSCERCGRRPPTVVLQNSHFFTRNARSTRYDEDNCDCLCSGCHFYFERRKNAEYLEWKQKKLGPEQFNALRKRYYTMRPRPPTEQEKKDMLDSWK